MIFLIRNIFNKILFRDSPSMYIQEMFAPLISPVQIDVQELMDFVDKDSLSQVRTNNLKGKLIQSKITCRS